MAAQLAGPPAADVVTPPADATQPDATPPDTAAQCSPTVGAQGGGGPSIENKTAASRVKQAIERYDADEEHPKPEFKYKVSGKEYTYEQCKASLEEWQKSHKHGGDRSFTLSGADSPSEPAGSSGDTASLAIIYGNPFVDRVVKEEEAKAATARETKNEIEKKIKTVNKKLKAVNEQILKSKNALEEAQKAKNQTEVKKWQDSCDRWAADKTKHEAELLKLKAQLPTLGAAIDHAGSRRKRAEAEGRRVEKKLKKSDLAEQDLIASGYDDNEDIDNIIKTLTSRPDGGHSATVAEPEITYGHFVNVILHNATVAEFFGLKLDELRALGDKERQRTLSTLFQTISQGEKTFNRRRLCLAYDRAERGGKKFPFSRSF